MKNKIVKKVITGALLATLVASIFGGMTSCKIVDRSFNNSSTDKESSSVVNTMESVSLPSAEKATESLKNILGENFGQYMLKGETVVRLPAPENGDPIKVNITSQMTSDQLDVIRFSFEEYNKIFEVINPDYVFKVNAAPTQEDLDNPYNIDIDVVDAFEGNEKGIAFATGDIFNRSGNVDGYETYNNKISIRKDCLNNSEALMGALKHEVGHLLGRGDGYNNEFVTEKTIMSGGTLINGSLIVTPYSSLQKTDVAILDAIYRQPDNILTNDAISNFINNYADSNKFSYSHYASNNDFEKYKREIVDIDFDVLIESIKNSDYDETMKQELIDILETNPTINIKFGEGKEIIAECPNERNKGIYYQIDGNNIRWESTNSFGSRQVYRQSGIVRKGDEYSGSLMINVGNYVLSFDYQKDYITGEIEVSDEISQIFKQTELTYNQYLDYLEEYKNQEEREQE